MIEMTSTTKDGDLNQSPTDSPSRRNKFNKEGENIPLPATPQCRGTDVPSEDIEDVGPGIISRSKMFLIAMGMCLTYFLGAAAMASAIIMIPDIARSLEVSELQAQWVVSAYALAYGCGLLFAGRFADLFGRKRLYLGGLSIYCVFSIFSAIVKNRIGLCILRSFSGLGLAIASPAGFGIVGVTFRYEPESTIAFAAFGLGSPLGAVCGVMIGGAMAAIGPQGWSYLFYLLGGVALIPIAIGILVIPKDDLRRQVGDERRVDWTGGFLVTAGLCLFCFSVTESGIAEKRWATPYVPVLLTVSIIILVIFGFWERRLERGFPKTCPPIVKVSLFTRHSWKVSYVIISTFLSVMAVTGYVYLVTIWYQSYLGMTALQGAVRMLPWMISGIVAAASIMWLGPRFKAPILIVVACSLSCIACLLFAVVPGDTTYWAGQFVSLSFSPWGLDMMVCLGNVMMSNLVEQDEQSVGGAIFQTSIQIGASIGTCLASLISTSREESTGDLSRGLRDGFWTMFAFMIVVIFIVGLGLRNVGLAGDVRGHTGTGGNSGSAPPG